MGALPEGAFPLAVVEISTISVVTLSLFGAQEKHPKVKRKPKMEKETVFMIMFFEEAKLRGISDLLIVQMQFRRNNVLNFHIYYQLFHQSASRFLHRTIIPEINNDFIQNSIDELFGFWCAVGFGNFNVFIQRNFHRDICEMN